jgi:hypothetical protein
MTPAEHTAHIEWLAGLKPGDPIVIRKHRGQDGWVYETHEAARLTTTQIVVTLNDSEVRYRRDNGRGIGFAPGALVQPTPEIRAAIMLTNDRRWLTMLTLNGDRVRAIPPAALRAMHTAYEAAMLEHAAAHEKEPA